MSQSGVALLSICALLVPQLGIEIAGFRLQLTTSWKDDAEQLKQGMAAVTQYSWLAIAVAVLINVGTAIAVALTTQNLDSRMLAIITGISRLMAAVYAFFISVKIPKWLGVYHSIKSLYGTQVGHCLRELKFNLVWNIWGHFTEVYFFLILFYNGVAAATIPLAAIIGIALGFCISVGIYLGRTRFKLHKNKIAMVMATILSILSSLATASGCIWIQTVWGQDITNNEIVLGVVAFVLWLLVQLGVHYVQYKISQRMLALQRRISHKYKTVLFEHGAALLQKMGGDPDKYGTNDKNDNDREIDLEMDLPNQSGDNPDASTQKFAKGEPDLDNVADGSQIAPTNVDNNRSKSTSKGEEQEDEDKESSNVADDIDAGVAVAETVAGIEEAMSQLNEDSELASPEESEPPVPEQPEEDPTLCSLFLGKCCCCCCSCRPARNGGTGYPPLSYCDRFVKFIKWALWTALSIFFLFLTIVNIGATNQVDAVNTNLPITEAALYTNMNAGPVCAFNNQGANSTITTFSSLAAANQAGYSVLHCGACGYCSTWDNLRIEYRTRDSLAAMAQACGKLTLFQGYDAAIQCQMQTIGFDLNCSECWVNDEVCARDNCAFIYIQALLINNVGNFKVAPHTITSATCEEAMCERVFVPCSGASRRRMNIVSSIARPSSEQCTIVQANYTQLFGS